MSDEEVKNSNQVFVFNQESGNYALTVRSSEDNNIVEVGKTFLIDGHMHIQSLNCTPLQLQWATFYLQTAGFIKSDDNRKETNETASGRNFLGGLVRPFATKDLGVIGQQSTDVIGDLYMRRVKNNEVKLTLNWMLKTPTTLDSDEKKEEAGDEFELQKTSEKKQESLENFFESDMISSYYDKLKPFHMNISHPMDLSYAHFWGIHRLPMILNDPKTNEFYYINDYKKIDDYYQNPNAHTNRGGANTSNEKSGFKLVWDFEPLYQGFWEASGVRNRIHHLLYDFPVKEELDHFTKYIEAKFVDKTSTTEKPKQIVNFDIEKYKEVIEDTSLSETDKGKKLIDLNANLYTKYFENGDKVKYNHFIDIAPDEEIEIFEDYTEQLSYNIATAFRYPMQLLPFYHFDPRRHFSSDNKNNIAETITKEHRFMTIKDSYGDKEIQGHDGIPTVKFYDKFDKQYFEEHFFKGRYEEDDWGKKENLYQAPYKKDIEEFKYNLFPTDSSKEEGKPNPAMTFPPHIFWGVKMYPPLGYSPDLYNHSKERFDLSKDHYKHFKDFFSYCQDAQIPITAHGSPMGMSIGDGFNYIKNDQNAVTKNNISKDKKGTWPFFLKKLKDNKLQEYKAKEAALYVDLTSTHTECWGRVFKDFPKLKYCFAHFGSGKSWDNPFKESPPISDISAIDSEYKDEHKDWRNMISGYIKKYKNIYTDISCYVMAKSRMVYEKDRPPRKVISRTVKKYAKHIQEAIDDNPHLFDRIIMGSDWYMIETSNDTGVYYKTMFEMLKLMSEKSGKYDYWHQFSVINPLRFLGLLDGDPEKDKKSDDAGEYYEVNTEKIGRYLDKLKGVSDTKYKTWWEYAGIQDSIELSDKKEQSLKDLKTYFSIKEDFKIYTSEAMFNRQRNSIKDL